MASIHPQRTGQSSINQRPHQSLARRLLFPNHSGDLPLLLKSPNVPPELQAEFYDFIALALRAYVNTWWTKITRYDKDLLPQTTCALTTVICALESRTLALDLPSLVFQDLPMIITQHYRDYRNAASKVSSSYASGGAASLPQLFHHLQPHIALSAEGNIDLEYYRQIIDHILRACLPLEDYAPEAERLIVREVIVKVLVHDIIPKISEPWFIQKTILDLLSPYEDQQSFKPSVSHSQPATSSFSLHTFIVLILSVLQSFSSTCLALIHAYKQAISTIKLVNQSPAHTPQTNSPPLPSSQLPVPPIESIPSTPQAQSRASYTASISPAPSNMSSVSYPSRSALMPRLPLTDPLPGNTQSTAEYATPPPQYINYASSPLTLISEVFLTYERLAATSLMTLFGMISASMTPFLDKLLPHLLYNTLSPGFILNIVRLSKRTMFPNGYPGPSPIEPTPEEQAEIRERLVKWRGKVGLSHLSPLLLGTNPSETINAAINPLTSQPCNVHLIVILIDRILVGLFPELTGNATEDDRTIMTMETRGIPGHEVGPSISGMATCSGMGTGLCIGVEGGSTDSAGPATE